MWYFVSDLHGHVDRYRKLFAAAARERPSAIFIGGDLLPSGLVHGRSIDPGYDDFINDFLIPGFAALRDCLCEEYPAVFVIMGNDDPRIEEQAVIDVRDIGVWHYLQGARMEYDGVPIYGYGYVPPTPFMLKDWERYDVSRFVDPGCSSPEEGWRSVPVSPSEIKYGTIAEDLQNLAQSDGIEQSVWLFHAPPYDTLLDRAALDGVVVEHVPVDVHVGSIAVRRFIEQRQPMITLHGHIHESARLTGQWREQIGRTHCFSAAHDGPELALVRFDLKDPASATRELL